MTIGKNIKQLRTRYGLSQKEIALIAGVTDKAVSTWENDIKEPRMGAIQKIADHFGIQKSNIIEEDGLDHPSSPAPLPELTSRDERLTITAPEMGHIKKYRALDERGKATVDTVLKTQYDAAMVAKEAAADYEVETIAAHNDDSDHPLPPEALASIEAFKAKMREKYGKK